MDVITTSKDRPSLFPSGGRAPFILVIALFLLWGLPASLNDVLIKLFMRSFVITPFKAGLIQSAYFGGYFLLSMPAALIMRRYGYKIGLVIGLFLYGTGAVLFWPAAIAKNYGMFLVALSVIASGASFLETGANPFIATAGDSRTSERRLNFAQSFNSIGTMAGALIGTMFFLSRTGFNQQQVRKMKASGEYLSFLQHETMKVVKPYVVIGAIAIVLAVLILLTKFPKSSGEGQPEGRREPVPTLGLFKYRHFILGVIAQFLYMGAMTGTRSFYIPYLQDYIHITEQVAGYFLIGSLAVFTVGRFVSTYLMKYFLPERLMGCYGIINCGLVTISVMRPGWVGAWALFFSGFFMSLMFPTIFALGIRELGPYTSLGSSLMIMSFIGGAVLPPIQGLIYMVTQSMAISMVVLLLCFAFIAYYGFVGSRVQSALV